MTNLFAYLTVDPGNASWAQELAARWGIPLLIVDPRDIPRLHEELIPIVVDWDYLECMGQQREELFNGALKIAAVHGRNLPAYSCFWTRSAIVVAPSADDAFFAKIAGARTAA
jgi:hypothetical protein